MQTRLEIDHRALKLMIALVAFTLANITSFLADGSILSVSEAYGYGGWARDVLVGAMFAVAAFMFAYNGYHRTEKLLTNVTAVAALCRVFYLRARRKGLKRASRRARLYAVCGIVMLISMLVVVVDHFMGDPLRHRVPRLVFHCEQVALFAFGIAWLAASHIVPWLTDPDERWI